MTKAMRAVWDAEAERFDDQPDHGLLDPAVRAAQWSLLSQVLPPARVLDMASGTGSVAILLAERACRDDTGLVE